MANSTKQTSNPTKGNMILLFYVLLVGLILILAYRQGIAQEQAYRQDRLLFNQALQTEDNEDALAILQQTTPEFQRSWLVIYSFGYIYYLSGQYQQADCYMSEAENMRPVFLTTPSYLIIRGHNYVMLGNKEEALIYLNQAVQTARNEEEKQKALAYLQEAQALEQEAY